MKNLVREITYTSINDFFTDIIHIDGKLKQEFFGHSCNGVYNKYIFRGLTSKKHSLIPSALRPDNEEKVCKLSGYISPEYGITRESEQIECEDHILKKFYLACDYNGLKIPRIENLRYHNYSQRFIDRYWLPNDYFELAGLAQHYGLPTRLLDWSFDFFIALYFAIKKSNDTDEHCTIWAFNYSGANHYFADRENKLKIIIPEYSQNPNLNAQKGVLTHWQTPLPDLKSLKLLDRRPLDELISDHIEANIVENNVLFYKINIPKTFSKELYIYLVTNGIDGSRLFPGYQGVVLSMNENATHIKEYEW
jgi:hypothetical protein